MSRNIVKSLINKCRLADKYRYLSAIAQESRKECEKMSSWQIHSYGSLEELQLSQLTRIPFIKHPDEVLIKVASTSVNPLDVAMIGGYGSTALNVMRNIENVEFPLILGRDFSGTVVSKGLGDCNNIPLGTSVWGVVPVHLQGCHAEYVLVDRKMIGKKPDNLSDNEAASMLYTGLTAWSGLRYSAGLTMNNMSGLRTLVLGASGGVGNAAIQMLHVGQAKVSATCSSDAISLVESLGADIVYDYTSPDYEQRLIDNGPFDLILDCAGLGSDYATKKNLDFRNYVTFTTPVLKNLDSLGLFRGVIASASDLICPNVEAIKKGRVVKWAYFVPSFEGISYIYELASMKKMKPVVEKVYKFNEAPDAYKKVKEGHMRGKAVISLL